MFIYDLARKVNKKRKQYQKNMSGRFLSPVRKIERVAPLSTGKYVAMTFDDGPNALPPNPAAQKNYEHAGLTDILLDILKTYDARGTFDVIGTTEYNYPDKTGKSDSFSWGGRKFDHYPDFGKDGQAGIKNQLQIAKRMILEGHELASHGYRHVLFGPMKLVYGGRKYFKSLEEVIDDLSILHDYIMTELNYEMKLARPPHYIDRIPDGHSSYDAYSYMNYQYLAASFDGGGWKPSSGSYGNDVAAMVKPLEQGLSADISSLNGQIIFQKDGCNMSRQTPVADALDKHLELLSQAGYKVITVSELLRLSPFEDISDTDPAFCSVQQLAGSGHCVGYKNNTFQPDRVLTKGELLVMLTPPIFVRKLQKEQQINQSSKNPYTPYISLATRQAWFQKAWGKESYFDSESPVAFSEFARFLDVICEGEDICWNPPNKDISLPSSGFLKRRDFAGVLAALTNKAAYNKLYI